MIVLRQLQSISIHLAPILAKKYELNKPTTLTLLSMCNDKNSFKKIDKQQRLKQIILK